MALNEVFRDADHIALPVAADTLAGTAIITAGGLKGVTETPEGQGGNIDGEASVSLKGAYRLPVTGAVAKGAAVYIPAAGGALTATATGNVLYGHALETKGSGTAPIVVRIARA